MHCPYLCWCGQGGCSAPFGPSAVASACLRQLVSMLKIQNHEEDDLRVVYYADLERRMDEHTLAGLLKFVLEVQNMQGVPRQGPAHGQSGSQEERH